MYQTKFLQNIDGWHSSLIYISHPSCCFCLTCSPNREKNEICSCYRV